MKRGAVKHVLFIGIAMTAFIAGASAAENVTKARLLGAWCIVSTENILANGTHFSPFPNGTGMLMFDRSGHFSWILLRTDIPKMASNNRLEGTPGEFKAIATGTLTYFGTYSVDSAKNVLTMHIENSTFANFNGAEQERTLVLDGDELQVGNAAGASGGRAVVTWKRIN